MGADRAGYFVAERSCAGWRRSCPGPHSRRVRGGHRADHRCPGHQPARSGGRHCLCHQARGRADYRQRHRLQHLQHPGRAGHCRPGAAHAGRAGSCYPRHRGHVGRLFAAGGPGLAARRPRTHQPRDCAGAAGILPGLPGTGRRPGPVGTLALPLQSKPMTADHDRLLKAASEVLDTEARAIQALSGRLNADFVTACRLILSARGHVVVTGMGKSGHIGHKLAATLASTGTPAFFVHPAEASHGDLGMITPEDIVLAFSNSGETSEVLAILPVLKRRSIPLISLTGRPESTLATQADIHIPVIVHEEACPLNLAPTSSTTAALAMGDALAIALLEARDFSAEDFALSHPGGSLGRRLLLQVADIMHTGERLPVRSEEHTSELQSRGHLVCRLLLEKKNKHSNRLRPKHKPTPAPQKYAVEDRTT